MDTKETIKKKRPIATEPEHISFKTASSCTFRPEYCAMLRDHIGKGFSLNSFDVGVTNKTLYRWLSEYPEFASARDAGERKKLKILEAAGMKMVVQDGNVQAWKLLMNQYGVVEKTATHNINENVEIEASVDEVDMIEYDTKRAERIARIQSLTRKLEIDVPVIEGEVIDA